MVHLTKEFRKVIILKKLWPKKLIFQINLSFMTRNVKKCFE
jgi:hypothetical protein